MQEGLVAGPALPGVMSPFYLDHLSLPCHPTSGQARKAWALEAQFGH